MTTVHRMSTVHATSTATPRRASGFYSPRALLRPAPLCPVVRIAPSGTPALDRMFAVGGPVLTRRTPSPEQLSSQPEFALADAVADVKVHEPLPAAVRPWVDGRIRQVLDVLPSERREDPLLRRLAAIAALHEVWSVAPADRAADQPGRTVSGVRRASLTSAAADVSQSVALRVRTLGRQRWRADPGVNRFADLPAAVGQLFTGLPEAVTTVTGLELPLAQELLLLAPLREAVVAAASRLALGPEGLRAIHEAGQELAAVWDRSWVPGSPVSADRLAEKLADQLSLWQSRGQASQRCVATGLGPVAGSAVVDQWARATVALADLGLPAAVHDLAQQWLDELFGPDRWGESTLLPHLAVAAVLRKVVLRLPDTLTPADRRAAEQAHQQAVLLAATGVIRRGHDRPGRKPSAGRGAAGREVAGREVAGREVAGRSRSRGLTGLLIEGAAPALTEVARAWSSPPVARVPPGATLAGRGPGPLVLALRDVIRETLGMQSSAAGQQQLSAGLGDQAWQELAASVERTRGHWSGRQERLLQQLGDVVDGLVRPLQDGSGA